MNMLYHKMKYLFLYFLAATPFVLSHATLDKTVKLNLIARAPPIEWIPVDGKTGKSDIQKARSHSAKQQHAKVRQDAEARYQAMRRQTQNYPVGYGGPAVVHEYRDQGPIADDRDYYRDSYRGDTYQPPLTYSQDRGYDTRRREAYESYNTQDHDDFNDHEEAIREIQRMDTPYRNQFQISRSVTPADVARENSRSRGAGNGRGESLTYQSHGPSSKDNTPPSSRHAPSSNGPPLYVDPRSPQKKFVSPGEYEYIVRKRYLRRDSNIRSHQKRMDPLEEISSESDSMVQASNNSMEADFEDYLAFYYEVQNNISDALFPFFDTVLNNTNSSLVYNTVWSVFSDLTGIGPKIIGPFAFGLHCFDWIEDAYMDSVRSNNTQNTSRNITQTNLLHIRNTTKSTKVTGNGTNVTNDPFFQDLIVTNYMLIQLYNWTWSEANAIADKTGEIDMLDGLTDILLSMNSSASSSWTSPQPEFDSSYFQTYVMSRSG